MGSILLTFYQFHLFLHYLTQHFCRIMLSRKESQADERTPDLREHDPWWQSFLSCTWISRNSLFYKN